MTIKFWLELMRNLRKKGEFGISDELREMLRRMGWEIRQGKKEYQARRVFKDD